MGAHIAAKQPAGVELEAGKDYYWCSCGHSKNQPFCDGSHNAVNKAMPEGEKKIRPTEIHSRKIRTALVVPVQTDRQSAFLRRYSQEFVIFTWVE